MNARTYEIVEELRKHHRSGLVDAVGSQTRQASLTGELMVLLAEEQVHAAEKLDANTKGLISQTETLVKLSNDQGQIAEQNVKLQTKLVNLTRALLYLTVFLALITAFQLYLVFHSSPSGTTP